MPLAALALAACLAPAAEKPAATAADIVTLRDGSVVLGQVVEPAPRGSLPVLVRREWARAEQPDRAARWEAAEAATLRRARIQRRERLQRWRQQRAAVAVGNDSILAWIDRELAAAPDPEAPAGSKLMTVALSRAEVRSVVRRPLRASRMLRQGWLSGFANVENMPLDALEGALEGRGFALGARTPVAIDSLLPTPVETDAQWSNRRAATEVLNDSGLRFVRTGAMLLPEPTPGQALGADSAVSVLGDLKQLLEGRPSDPLAETLRGIAARGRIGAVVTQLDISPDLSAVRVESVVWVRRSGRWVAAGTRRATVRPGELGPRAGEPLAQDPQVQAVFQLVESIGLGKISDEVKQRSLNVGAATQQALGKVRSALMDDLGALAFPVREVAEQPPGK